jgi:hypothetical protein
MYGEVQEPPCFLLAGRPRVCVELAACLLLAGVVGWIQPYRRVRIIGERKKKRKWEGGGLDVMDV